MIARHVARTPMLLGSKLANTELKSIVLGTKLTEAATFHEVASTHWHCVLSIVELDDTYKHTSDNAMVFITNVGQKHIGKNDCKS